MSEEQDPFEPMVRATLAETDQEPFEAMMRRMCSAVLRDMQPQAAKEARAELRDRFAMAALTGLLAESDHRPRPRDAADWSYDYADAMLKARGDE